MHEINVWMYTLMTVVYCRLGCAWLYYGVVLLTTSLIQNDPHCGKFLHKLLKTLLYICN